MQGSIDLPEKNGSDAKALAAATFTGNIGIAEAKCLIEPLFDKINLGSVDESQALLINHDRNAAIFEDPVFLIHAVRIVHDVGKTIAAGLFDADSEPDAAASSLEVIPHPFCCRFGK